MKEKKKSNSGVIIIAIIIILLLLFLVWFFLLRGNDKDNGNNTANNDNKQENTNTDDPNAKPNPEKNNQNGVLVQVTDEDGKPLQTDLVIDGIILVGNRHSYDGLDAESEGVIEKLVQQGYKKEGINSSFYLNEWIEFYIDTKYNGSEDDAKILIAPYKAIEELKGMSFTQLENLALDNGGYEMGFATPDEEQHKFVADGYVNMDYPEGKYIILFTYKGKLAYYINIELTKEPTE